MPRKLTLTEAFRFVDSLDMYLLETTTPGNTVTTADADEGDADLTTAAITNFSTGDPLFIDGSGGLELNAAEGAPSGNTITLLYKVKYPQLTGATVREAKKVALGHLGENGVTYTPSRPATAVNSATSDTVAFYIEGNLELGITFDLLGFNGPNILLQAGVDDNETGAGSAADPWTVAIGPSTAKIGVAAFRMSGRSANTDAFLLDFLNARFDASGSTQFNRRQAAPVQCSIKCTGLIMRQWQV